MSSTDTTSEQNLEERLSNLEFRMQEQFLELDSKMQEQKSDIQSELGEIKRMILQGMRNNPKIGEDNRRLTSSSEKFEYTSPSPPPKIKPRRESVLFNSPKILKSTERRSTRYDDNHDDDNDDSDSSDEDNDTSDSQRSDEGESESVRRHHVFTDTTEARLARVTHEVVYHATLPDASQLRLKTLHANDVFFFFKRIANFTRDYPQAPLPHAMSMLEQSVVNDLKDFVYAHRGPRYRAVRNSDFESVDILQLKSLLQHRVAPPSKIMFLAYLKRTVRFPEPQNSKAVP